MSKQETIRVAHIIGKWLGGGVESVVMNYYRYIDKNKIQFDFICDNDSTNIPYEEIEKLGGKVILIPPYQKVFKYHKELKKVLKDGNYKIVHSHINTLSVFSLFAAKSAGVPVRIAHSHSTIAKSKNELLKNVIKRILKIFSKKYANIYFACSEEAGVSQFGKKIVMNKNFTIINNAIDIEKYKYSKNTRLIKRNSLNISESTIVIGHVGRFVHAKNYGFILDVFKEIHQINGNSKLLLVGSGELETKIKEKVNILEIRDSVVFLGQRDDLSKIYQAMDVFIFPSFYEGLGMALIEAQTSGLLCFASTCVPEKSKIIETTRFISLEKSHQYWAKEILKEQINFSRKKITDEVSKSGFDIKIESKRLKDKYLEMLGEKCNAQN